MEDLVLPFVHDWMSRPTYGAGSEHAPESQIALASRLAEHGMPFPAFSGAFARTVARLYVSGHISFEQGDNAIGWLHHYSLMGPHGGLLDEFAWQVYRAFDAGEYHPTESTSVDLPAKYTLPKLRQLLSSAAA